VGNEGILIALAVFAWILWRQLQVRELRRDRSMILPLVLVVVGVAEIVGYAHDHPLHPTGYVLLVVAIVVAGIFGAIRASTVRLWIEDGKLLRQGTYVTCALWLLALAIHLGGDHLIAPHDADRLGGVSLLLYLGFSLAVQRWCLNERARRRPGPPAPAGA
jgi:drug/metabolite transporter (DMT)-like permease